MIQYGIASWYHHLQEAAPTEELLDSLTKLASDETAIDGMDELKRNMRHWLCRADVLAVILSWLKIHVSFCPLR